MLDSLLFCNFSSSGYWLFHCHLSFHIEVGMGLIFKVGEEHDFPPVPKDFPKCGSWLPPMDEDDNENDISLENSVSIQGLPNNISDARMSITTEQPKTSSTIRGELPTTTTESDDLTSTHISLTSEPDEENFVYPQRLTNGTLSHSEVKVTVYQSTSGSNRIGCYFYTELLAYLLLLSYFYAIYSR